jgi:hypothetical protein
MRVVGFRERSGRNHESGAGFGRVHIRSFEDVSKVFGLSEM